MTSRERRVRQTEPYDEAGRYQRNVHKIGKSTCSELSPNERTAERRVASYRPLLNALARDHVICGNDPCEFTALVAALRRPTVTEAELAEAINTAWCNGDAISSDATIAARVALEMVRK